MGSGLRSPRSIRAHHPGTKGLVLERTEASPSIPAGSRRPCQLCAPPWAPQRGPVGGQGPRDRGHAEAGGVRTCWYRCAHTCPIPSQGLAKTLASERELPLGPPGLSKENEPPAFPLGTAQRGLGLGRGQKETRPGSGPLKLVPAAPSLHHRPAAPGPPGPLGPAHCGELPGARGRRCSL